MINRRILLKELHMSYERHVSLKEYICFYCGAPADGEDHCPALSLAKQYDGHDRILVRCCRLCNSLLGDKFLLTLTARLEFLKKSYLKRWHKDLDMPEWTELEIEELSGELKREVIKGIKRKKRAYQVLTHIDQKLEIYLGDLYV